jgi:plasmid stabilization system protein ParE
VKRVITATARRDIRAADAWWREHRPEAPDAVEHEVQAALSRLDSQPHSGTPHASWDDEVVFRVFLEKTQRFLYYVVRDDTLVVLRLHGARRGTQPRFSNKTDLS